MRVIEWWQSSDGHQTLLITWQRMENNNQVKIVKQQPLLNDKW